MPDKMQTTRNVNALYNDVKNRVTITVNCSVSDHSTFFFFSFFFVSSFVCVTF